MNKILFVDDEQNIRRLVAYDLKQAGYDHTLCENGEEAYQACVKDKYDVIIVDWMMPLMDGLSLVKKLRQDHNPAIIIMLTAKDGEDSLLEAFEAGVDDYMRKPFSSRELIVRIKAHLSRVQTASTDVLAYHEIQLQLNSRSVNIHNNEVLLTKIEFDLLHLFIKEHPNVLSRDYLLNTIWGFDYDGDTRIVDIHVFNLRQKIKIANVEIKSSRGIGYQLV
ncbi:MAG: response regulator transcription factor [Erysipelotrichaceae bacterium]